MASYSKTTAVSLRKGNTSENNNFTGVLGELVVDLGADGTGTDLNTTLRLHNGVIQGGIPLARTDLTNITTKTLAENRTIYDDKNLSYADLSNFEESEEPAVQNKLVKAFSEYGLAKNNMSNVDTADLATEGAGHIGKNLSYTDFSNVDTADLATEGAGHAGKNLAYTDMSNVNTTSLASIDTTAPHAGKNLAYADLSNLETLTNTQDITKVKNTLHGYGLASAEEIENLGTTKAEKDMSNVDTADLAEDNGHSGKNLAYYDASNMDTENLTKKFNERPSGMAGPILARSDLTNVDDSDFKTKATANNVEYTTRKIDEINTASENIHTEYTTSNAVINYIKNNIDALINDYATINFDNVIDWDRLYQVSSNIFKYNNSSEKITTEGSGFTLNVSDGTNSISTIAPTSKALTGTVNLKLAVYNVIVDSDELDRPEIPTIYRVYPEYGKTNITATTITFKNNYGSTATATLYCQPHTSVSGLYCYFVDIKSSDVLGPDGTHNSSYGWKGNDSNNINEIPLYDNIDDIQVQPVLCIQPTTISSGKITNFTCIPENSNEILTGSSITVYHPMIITRSGTTPTFAVQSGNTAKISLSTIVEAPGANLLKRNLENLLGITAYDKICNANANWTINKLDAIPAVTEATISDREYDRIATVGQVWDCAKKIDSKIVFRNWS